MDYLKPKKEEKCNKCKYEYLSECEHPCIVCRWKVKERGLAFFGKLSYFEPKEEKNDDEIDMVNHPQHYNRDGAMECIDEMIAVFGKDIVACFCLCNADSWNYGMNHKDELLKLGFTKQEMDAFILDKYEELVKEKEEDEDD